MICKYKTEGSDRKHGALVMCPMCACGWSGSVINGQGAESQQAARQQWLKHIAAEAKSRRTGGIG